MTKPDARTQADWLRKVDRAASAYEKRRQELEEVVTDARNAGVPLMTIADHTPYTREWARKVANKVDAERANAIDPAE